MKSDIKFWFCCAFSIILFSSFVAEKIILDNLIQNAWSDYKIVSENNEKVIYADEALTMSARLAVSTGDLKWVDRYNQFVPLIDSSIANVIKLSPENLSQRYLKETSSANDALIDLEDQAFALIKLGKLKEAQSLIEGEAYKLHKKTLSIGADNFAANTTLFLNNRINQLNLINTILSIFFVIATFILIYCWVIYFSRKTMASQKNLQRMKKIAWEDHLTGLLNRQGLDRFLLNSDLSEPYLYAIIDLDRFKPINDSFGHAVGDLVLQEIGNRFQELNSDDCYAFRIGGDEFSIFSKDTQDLENIDAFAHKIYKCLIAPIHIQNQVIEVGASIGICLSKDVEGDFGLVSTSADAAMYSAKNTVDHFYKVYSPNMAQHIRNLDQKSELSIAIAEGQIRPYFQRKINLATNEVIGFEVLARWEHPTKGILLPDDFIADIAKFDLNLDFSCTMLEQVFEQLKIWSKRGYDISNISVNIGKEILLSSKGFEKINKLLGEYEAFKDNLIFEMTDVILSNDENNVDVIVQSLINQGVKLSIANYGATQTSFEQLFHMDFHEIKIDRSLVKRIGQEQVIETVLQAIMKIAAGFKANVIAEGVETQEQCDFLLSIDCQYAQGFHYGKAESIEETEKLLRMSKTEKPAFA